MDRYEYKVKFQEINNLIDEKEYFEAAAIADTIDWEKKPVETLVRIGDLYRKVMRYDDAIELLRLAYRKSPENRNICYYLCKLYIKKEYIVQAVYAYNEFERIARPNDPRVYKLKYMRDQMLHVEMAQKIATLETLKNIEYTEKWAYTLAYQYYLDGRESDCVRECDELIAAFGDGKYVYAAMLLKKKYTELTPEQQKIFDNWKEETEETDSTAGTENAESNESTESGQSYEYATREIPGDDTRRISQEEAGSTRNITAEEIDQIRGATAPEETIVYDPAQVMMALEKTNLSDETRIFKGINIPEEPEIKVKTVDVGQFNTIDLQKALSASVREVVGVTADAAGTDVTKAIMAPMLDPDTGSLDDPEYADFIRCAKAKPHWGNKETGEVFVEFEKILNLLSEGSVFELDYCGNFPLMNGWLIAEFDKRGKEVRPGDKIMAKGILVTVAKVLAQDYYGGTWDVEFIDNAGNYRHWKSELDGGKVIYKE